MTIIEGEEGITVVDPLISAETAKVGIDLYYANRGRKPVKAVIYTHSHVDHFGGVRGIVDEADVRSGAVKIYAPEGRSEEHTSELQSLMRISYAVFCLKKKIAQKHQDNNTTSDITIRD